MKRTEIDINWFTVGDLKHRALGDKIYLSPLSDIPNEHSGLTQYLPNTSFDTEYRARVQDSTEFLSSLQTISRFKNRAVTINKQPLIQPDRTISPSSTAANTHMVDLSPVFDEMLRTISDISSAESHCANVANIDGLCEGSNPFPNLQAQVCNQEHLDLIETLGVGDVAVHHLPGSSIDFSYTDSLRETLGPLLYSSKENEESASDASITILSQCNPEIMHTFSQASSSLDDTVNNYGGKRSKSQGTAKIHLIKGVTDVFSDYSHTFEKESSLLCGACI